MEWIHSLRKRYWNISNQLARIQSLFEKQNQSFAKEVINSYLRHYIGDVKPIEDISTVYADRAVKWLLKAQTVSENDGVSYGYFPCHWEKGWRPSYPETTGYIIPSLLEYAQLKNDREIRKCAIAMADWEASIQMTTGAVQGGILTTPDRQKAAVFNTGMVLQGWTAAFRETGEQKFLEAGRKAAVYLVKDMDKQGHYRTHGSFVASDEVKTYNVLCSWALYRFGEDSGEDAYKEAALKNGEATLEMQLANGWFESCCLTNPKAPLTHTLGYTLQGLLELGFLAGRDDFISAAERGVIPLIQRVRSDGYLSGRFDRNWNSRARYSCLTGSAQIAIVLFRLSRIRKEAAYGRTADRLVNFLKALQLHNCPNPNMNGAIAGSFPLLGEYMTAGYPNWATKYFLDVLLLQNANREKL